MNRPTQSDVNRVVAALPYGKKNAISRAELAATVGMTDRRTRRCIELARDEGFFIVNGDRGGYALEVDLDAVEAQYRVDRARAISVLKRLKHMRQYLVRNGVKV